MTAKKRTRGTAQTRALDGGRWSTPSPNFTPRKQPATQRTGTWVGPRVGLEECGEKSLTLIRVRTPSRPPFGEVAVTAFTFSSLFCILDTEDSVPTAPVA